MWLVALLACVAPIETLETSEPIDTFEPDIEVVYDVDLAGEITFYRDSVEFSILGNETDLVHFCWYIVDYPGISCVSAFRENNQFGEGTYTATWDLAVTGDIWTVRVLGDKCYDPIETQRNGCFSANLTWSDLR